MLNTVFITIIASLFSALLTYFFTTIAQRKVFNEIVKNHLDVHNRVYHTNCPDNIRKLDRIEKAVIYMMVKAGHNLQEAGLGE